MIAPEFRKSLELVKSATTSVCAIYGKDLFQQNILLAPLNEQRRIVSTIEQLTDRSHKARAALEDIPKLIEQFRQSVLAAAFRGDLTADWREKNPDVEPALELLERIKKAHQQVGGHKKGNAAVPTDGVHTLESHEFPNSWEIAGLRDVCKADKPITYGILMPGLDVEDGIPYIRVADFPNNSINIKTIRKTSREIELKYIRSRLQEGDLLLSIRGTVGRICKISRALEGSNTTQDSARLSIQDIISIEYISWIMKAPSTQQRMGAAIKGVAVRGINIGDVRALQIPLPPYIEQHEIVKKIEMAMKIIDNVEEKYQEVNRSINRLDRSILVKAFRGELVPQDPNDEPAAILLDRIRAEREQISTLKQRGKTTRKNSSKQLSIDL